MEVIQMTKEELVEVIQAAVEATIVGLNKKGLLGSANNASASSASDRKSAYKQTEQLLFNYPKFRRLIEERNQQIEDIRQNGVPRGSLTTGAIGTEAYQRNEAIYAIRKSMETVERAVALVDRAMAQIKGDPYYKVVEMRYFEGRSQEDIASEYNCTQQSISYNMKRLVKQLSMEMLPSKVVGECLGDLASELLSAN